MIWHRTIPQAVVVGAIAIGDATTAAFVGGVFLIANTLVTWRLTRGHKDRTPEAPENRSDSVDTVSPDSSDSSDSDSNKRDIQSKRHRPITTAARTVALPNLHPAAWSGIGKRAKGICYYFLEQHPLGELYSLRERE